MTDPIRPEDEPDETQDGAEQDEHGDEPTFGPINGGDE